MGGKSLWPDYKSWRNYGIERGYNEVNSSSLSRSNELEERSWYARGQHRKWHSEFPYKRRKGYMKNWEKFKEEILKVIAQNNGEYPSLKTLDKLKMYSLRGWVQHHGGNELVRRKLGFDNSTAPYNYWKKWGNVRIKLETIIKRNNGKFPTSHKLGELRYGGLRRAIILYHGGINAVREKMGYGATRNSNGYLDDWQSFKKILLEAINKNKGVFPKYREFIDLGYIGIAKKLSRYGGINKIRKRLGFTHGMKNFGHYKKWRFVRNELEEIMQENNGEFPSHSYLNGKGYSSLSAAISRNYGGFPAVRERIGYNEKMREKLARELDGIVGEI